MKKDEALYILETYLTEEQVARHQRASDMTGAPISTLIRIAVADYLKNLPVRLSQGRNRPTTTDVVAQTQLLTGTVSVALSRVPLDFCAALIRARASAVCFFPHIGLFLPILP